MKLADLQAQFQAALLTGDTAILGVVPNSPHENKATLLRVYQNAYVIRLIDVLRTDYDKLAAYMGDDAFEAMARAYIAANPSTSRNARYMGSALPDFLRHGTEIAADQVVADLATLECAMNDAFDAADIPALSFEDLTEIAPEQWGDLVFTPHPSVHRLAVQTNAAAIWKALADELAPPAAETLTEPQNLLVWRQDLTVRYRVLAAEETMMWQEAANGVPFGRLCELVATFDAPDEAAMRAATYLKGWLDAGLLKQFRV